MRQTGTVRFFNVAEGFGLIAPAGESNDVILRASSLEASGLRDVNKGQQVSFETEQDGQGKGPKAVHIRLT
jgi:CspA family cold shock protein